MCYYKFVLLKKNVMDDDDYEEDDDDDDGDNGDVKTKWPTKQRKKAGFHIIQSRGWNGHGDRCGASCAELWN
jgi:hypothetical protein